MKRRRIVRCQPILRCWRRPGPWFARRPVWWPCCWLNHRSSEAQVALVVSCGISFASEFQISVTCSLVSMAISTLMRGTSVYSYLDNGIELNGVLPQTGLSRSHRLLCTPYDFSVAKRGDSRNTKRILEKSAKAHFCTKQRNTNKCAEHMRWPCLWLVACGIWTLRTQSILSSSLPVFGVPSGLTRRGWSYTQRGQATPSVSRTRGPHKVMPMCSRLLGRLPSDKTPVVSPLGCALVAVRACLLVLLCCAHPTKFLTRYLTYPVYPTVVPGVRHTNSTRVFCL
jgi:hypothetical protein